jgi:hypothetical protein
VKEALKLALDALEYWDVHGKLHQPTEEAITALRLAIDVQNMASESTYKAALAQPAQQEPVAVVETLGGYPDESRHEAKWLVPYRALKDGDNLYTTPPQRTWVGLTEARAKEIWLKGKDHGDDWLDVLALARAFEAELKELNT